jgi:hypothetical protein
MPGQYSILKITVRRRLKKWKSLNNKKEAERW